MIIRKNCCAVARACGGNSPRLTKCNCLAGYRVQPAPTRYRGGLGLPSLRQEPAPVLGRVQNPEPAPTRPGARRNSEYRRCTRLRYR